MSALSTCTAIELPTLGRQTSDRIDLIDEQQPSLQTSAHLSPVCRQSTCSCILACFLAASFIAITVLAMLLSKATVGISKKQASNDVRTTPGWPSFSSDTVTTASYSAPVASIGGSLGQETTPTAQPEPICYSEACIAAAKDLVNYVASEDSGADPCDDFYTYACRNSQSLKGLSLGRGASAFQTLTSQLDNQLRYRLWRNDEPLQKLKSVRLAREFYATCLNATIHYDEKSANQSVRKEINGMIGDQPLTDANNRLRLEYLAGLLKVNMNLDTIIGVSISINLRNVSEYAIVLDQPDFGIEDAVLLQPEKFPALVADYKRGMKAFAKTLTRDASNNGSSSAETAMHSDSDIHQLLQAASDIQADIIKLMVPQSRIASNHDAFYRATTLKHLLSDASNSTNSQQLNWTEFLRGYFGDDLVAAMQNGSSDYSVVVRADSYFDGLQKLFKSGKYSNLDWESYLMCRLAISRKSMLVDDQLLDDDITSTAKNAGDHSKLSSFGESGRPASEAALHSDNCLGHAIEHFAWAVTRLLRPNNQSELSVNSTRQKTMELELLTDAIVSAAAGIFTGIDWLDLPSKLNAERKQHGMVKRLMYPEWIFDNEKLDEFYDDLPETDWKTMGFYDQITVLSRWRVRKDKQKFLERQVPNRQQDDLAGVAYTMVNAFYQPKDNSIIIPAPIVQPPLYRAGAPKAVNYGGIGFVIGHEISHGYDAEGVQYFDNGTMYRWLDRSSYAGFNKMDQCIIDEYNGYCYTFKNNDSARLCIDGTFTQTENLADSAGVRAAWFALKAYESAHGPASRLPLGMRRFSSDQLFFLSLARPWCEKEPTRAALNHSLRTDTHSPSKWRINGALRNFQPFADVWQCKPGSSMAPLNRCHVW